MPKLGGNRILASLHIFRQECPGVGGVFFLRVPFLRAIFLISFFFFRDFNYVIYVPLALGSGNAYNVCILFKKKKTNGKYWIGK